MTIRHLTIFLAVCKYKSVTAAAEKLYLAQPTVSLAIRELEEHCHTRLFDRISRKLYLTEHGKQVLEYATHIVSLFQEMEDSIRDWDSAGMLRIGASITIGTELLPGYVSRFKQAHPQVKVRAAIDSSGNIEKKILDNTLDFGLIEGTIHDPGIIGCKFMEDELVLVCACGHPLAFLAQVEPEQLKAFDFILREPGSGTRELFDSTMLIHNLAIEPAWESTSTQAILRAVAAGHGLSVLPLRLAKAALDRGEVMRLNIRSIQFKRACYIIYHQNKFLTKPAQDFMALCQAQE